jgi:hypothetical protein
MTPRPVQTVTIPLTDYAELLDCRRRLVELKAAQRAFERPPKSPIDRDPELAAFIADRLGMAKLAEIRSACVAEFGPDRTPSRSAIARYWLRLRQQRAA